MERYLSKLANLYYRKEKCFSGKYSEMCEYGSHRAMSFDSTEPEWREITNVDDKYQPRQYCFDLLLEGEQNEPDRYELSFHPYRYYLFNSTEERKPTTESQIARAEAIFAPIPRSDTPHDIAVVRISKEGALKLLTKPEHWSLIINSGSSNNIRFYKRGQVTNLPMIWLP